MWGVDHSLPAVWNILVQPIVDFFVDVEPVPNDQSDNVQVPVAVDEPDIGVGGTVLDGDLGDAIFALGYTDIAVDLVRFG